MSFSKSAFNVVTAHRGEEPRMFEGYGDLLTVEDVSEVTGLSRQTVRACMAGGQIPAVKIGRRWFSPRARLAEMAGVR